jgi:hypothetical protein
MIEVSVPTGNHEPAGDGIVFELQYSSHLQGDARYLANVQTDHVETLSAESVGLCISSPAYLN